MSPPLASNIVLRIPSTLLPFRRPSLLGGRMPWTVRHHAKSGRRTPLIPPDAIASLPASSFSPIAYPAFEPPLSTDLISSVALTGTNHGKREAVH
ncbi:hypothetical protein K438DRAFT_1982898 [Mycena galopus ATCC 62051]|nr:hypothetical protein K438DRAFT_1982898 [Mycena galopus ATCC 62051]